MAEITFAREERRPARRRTPSFSATHGGNREVLCRLAIRAISRASSRVDRAKKEDLPASERNSRNSAGAAIRRRDAMRCDAPCSAS